MAGKSLLRVSRLIGEGEQSTDGEERQRFFFDQEIGKHLPGRHDQEDHGNRGGGLREVAESQGGFTYNPVRFKDRDAPKEGFALSISPENEKRILLSERRDIIKEQIKQYVRDHRAEIKQSGNFLGGWIENGRLYLDISKVMRNKDEAMKAARAAKQLAIFDLVKGETINLPKAA